MTVSGQIWSKVPTVQLLFIYASNVSPGSGILTTGFCWLLVFKIHTVVNTINNVWAQLNSLVVTPLH